MTENTNQEKVILNWKCFDNPGTSKSIFYNKSYNNNSHHVEKVFSEMKTKFEKEFYNEFLNSKTTLNICGGNYTSSFILPNVFQSFYKKYPFLPVSVNLFEMSKLEDLHNSDSDFLLTADQDFLKVNSKNIKKYQFEKITGDYDDAIYQASSKNSSLKMDKNFLKKANYIKARRFTTFKKDKEIVYPYQMKNTNLNNNIYIDYYFSGYMLMYNGIGIFEVLNKEKNFKDITILDENPLATLQRFFIKKNTVDTKYEKQVKKFFKINFKNEKK